MAVEVKIPATGESVSEVTIAKWLKSDGEKVKADESICVLESDKADFELPAPASGIITVLKKPGESVQVGEVIARIDESGKIAAGVQGADGTPKGKDGAPEGKDRRAESEPVKSDEGGKEGKSSGPEDTAHGEFGPAVRRLLREHDLSPGEITGSGRGGQITKGDVLEHLEARRIEKESDTERQRKDESIEKEAKKEEHIAQKPVPEPFPEPAMKQSPSDFVEAKFTFDGTSTISVPMTKIRRRIAARLVNARQVTAMLTTFNEIDMSAVMELRNRFKEEFDRVHGVSLGYMSFFSRACVVALREFPNLNARLNEDEIIYHRYVHLGIAVSTERGLVVPVLRNVESMSFARIEIEIKRMSAAARSGQLSISELSDGTFTLTNGGIFGSLLSTPILNMPQTGILGMHVIKKRPVVINDQIVIRPMMYVALTYDHRLVDGRDSVSFLVRLKDLLEDPARLMLDI